MSNRQAERVRTMVRSIVVATTSVLVLGAPSVMAAGHSYNLTDTRGHSLILNRAFCFLGCGDVHFRHQ